MVISYIMDKYTPYITSTVFPCTVPQNTHQLKQQTTILTIIYRLSSFVMLVTDHAQSFWFTFIFFKRHPSGKMLLLFP